MVRPARSRRSTAKATFRPSSRIYFRPRRVVPGGGSPDRSASAEVAALTLASQTPQIEIDVQSGSGANPLPSALAEYSFDEASGAVLDYSGNGHDFTLGGDTVRVSGHTGSGLGNTGGGAWSEITPAFGQTADRTLAMWMIDPQNVTEWVIRWNVESIDSGSWGFLLLGTEVSLQARNSLGFVRVTCTRPTDGLWHHYAATYDSGTATLKFFLDGVETDSDTVTAPLRTDADTIDIGAFTSALTAIDDLRVYDSALDAATIAEIAAVPVGESPSSDGPHQASFTFGAQDASVKIATHAGVALFDWEAKNAIPVQNIACAWFEATVTVDQHFCTVDLDSHEGAITLDAHEGFIGVDEHYGDVVVCGRP